MITLVGLKWYIITMIFLKKKFFKRNLANQSANQNFQNYPVYSSLKNLVLTGEF